MARRSQIAEKGAVLLGDLVAINLSLLIAYWLCFEGGLGAPSRYFALKEYFWPALVISGYWVFLLLFFGLYRDWKFLSRFDEVIAVSRAVLFGVAVLFFVTFPAGSGVSHPLPRTRLVLLSYWASLTVLVGLSRLGIRSIQKRLLVRGVGRAPSVIVGGGARGLELFTQVSKYPALGYDIVGFVCEDGEKPPAADKPALGAVEQLPEIVRCYNVEKILIALPSADHEEILRVISACNGLATTFYILPDLYDIVTGQARTSQIYGTPLIELAPELMPGWEKAAKRLIDIVASLILLVLLMPIWLIVAVLIKVDSKGPILFKQERAGKDGKRFMLYKFRSMVHEAERDSGPVWATRGDRRITRVGRGIRRLRLDESPQLWNVLRGEMSLVGPRPERPYFVEQFKDRIPLYARRLRVAPGLTGWAQTGQSYEGPLNDLKSKLEYERQKVAYDLYYIENMSLALDVKILLRTCWVVLIGRGAR